MKLVGRFGTSSGWSPCPQYSTIQSEKDPLTLGSSPGSEGVSSHLQCPKFLRESQRTNFCFVSLRVGWIHHSLTAWRRTEMAAWNGKHHSFLFFPVKRKQMKKKQRSGERPHITYRQQSHMGSSSNNASSLCIGNTMWTPTFFQAGG